MRATNELIKSNLPPVD